MHFWRSIPTLWVCFGGRDPKKRVERARHARSLLLCEPLEDRALLDGTGLGPLGPPVLANVLSWQGEPTIAGALETMTPYPNDQIYAFADSTNGRQMATSGRDLSITLWDAQTGMAGLRLAGHTKAVVDLAFSPDGTQLASASFDQTVRVWDLRSGAVTKQFSLPGLGDQVAFSRDGHTLLVGVYGQAGRMYDLTTGTIATFGNGSRASRFDFLPGTSTFAFAQGKDVTVWNTGNGNARTLARMQGDISSIAADPSGQLLAVGDTASGLRVFSPDGQLVAALAGHRGHVLSLDFAEDGRTFVSADSKGTVILWHNDPQARAISEARRWTTPGSVGTVVVSPDSSTVFAMTTPKGVSSITVLSTGIAPKPVSLTALIDALMAGNALPDNVEVGAAVVNAAFASREGVATGLPRDQATAYLTTAREAARDFLDQEIRRTEAKLEELRRGVEIDDPNLRHILAQSLLERSSFAMSVDRVEQVIRQAHPDVFVADMAAEIERRYRVDRGHSRGWHEQRLVNKQQDVMRTWRERINGHLSTIAGNLHQAMKVVLLREQGQVKEADALSRICDQNLRRHGNPLRALGIMTPTFGQLTNEAARIRRADPDLLVRMGKDQTVFRERQDYLSNLRHLQATDPLALFISREGKNNLGDPGQMFGRMWSGVLVASASNQPSRGYWQAVTDPFVDLAKNVLYAGKYAFTDAISAPVTTAGLFSTGGAGLKVILYKAALKAAIRTSDFSDVCKQQAIFLVDAIDFVKLVRTPDTPLIDQALSLYAMRPKTPGAPGVCPEARVLLDWAVSRVQGHK